MKQIIGFLVLVVLFAPVGCGGAGGIGTSANASPSNLLLAGVGKTIQIYYGAYGDAFANGAVSEFYPNVSGSSHVHDRFSRGRSELVWAADILD